MDKEAKRAGRSTLFSGSLRVIAHSWAVANLFRLSRRSGSGCRRHRADLRNFPLCSLEQFSPMPCQDRLTHKEVTKAREDQLREAAHARLSIWRSTRLSSHQAPGLACK